MDFEFVKEFYKKNFTNSKIYATMKKMTVSEVYES